MNGNEGTFENERNSKSADLFKSILRECFGSDDDVIIAHHLVYAKQEGDIFKVEEIPSADTLIFDHTIAHKVWGDSYLKNLCMLAIEPVESRDELLKTLYEGRHE